MRRRNKKIQIRVSSEELSLYQRKAIIAGYPTPAAYAKAFFDGTLPVLPSPVKPPDPPAIARIRAINSGEKR